MDDWDSLDTAAKQNLTHNGFINFLKYKEELKKDGHDWDDAQDILRGFIWDTIESEDPYKYDEDEGF